LQAATRCAIQSSDLLVADARLTDRHASIAPKSNRRKIMSVLGNIMSGIFGHGAKTQSAPTAAGSTSGPAATQSAPTAPGSTSGPAATSSSATTPTFPTAPSAAPASQVDVEAILTKLASQNSEKLDWRKSIVDLMKLLKLDSSLSARKELAKELHYSGDTNDSAAMNIWLHKQVMVKLAENGGKVPDELKA
jgi:hypothetical protein